MAIFWIDNTQLLIKNTRPHTHSIITFNCNHTHFIITPPRMGQPKDGWAFVVWALSCEFYWVGISNGPWSNSGCAMRQCCVGNENMLCGQWVNCELCEHNVLAIWGWQCWEFNCGDEMWVGFSHCYVFQGYALPMLCFPKLWWVNAIVVPMPCLVKAILFSKAMRCQRYFSKAMIDQCYFFPMLCLVKAICPKAVLCQCCFS